MNYECVWCFSNSDFLDVYQNLNPFRVENLKINKCVNVKCFKKPCRTNQHSSNGRKQLKPELKLNGHLLKMKGNYHEIAPPLRVDVRLFLISCFSSSMLVFRTVILLHKMKHKRTWAVNSLLFQLWKFLIEWNTWENQQKLPQNNCVASARRRHTALEGWSV